MSYQIAVLVPCYNEELTIAQVVNDFSKELTKLQADYIIYVYDNNSTDKTPEILKSLASQKVVCRKERLQGKGNVARSMFEDIEADCYIMVDADGTYNAKDVAGFITAVTEEHFDMVVGNRLSGTYDRENKRAFHSFGNRLVSKLVSKLFHSHIIDIMSGYRAFSRKFVKTSGLLAHGFEVETEMTILALDGHYKIKEILIDYRDRMEGSESKLNTYTDGFRVLKTILALFKDYKALEFFLMVAGLCGVLFLVLFIPVGVEFLHTGLVRRFPTLFVSGFFAVAAVLSLCMGVISDSICKMNKWAREVIKLGYTERK